MSGHYRLICPIRSTAARKLQGFVQNLRRDTGSVDISFEILLGECVSRKRVALVTQSGLFVCRDGGFFSSSS